MLIERPTLESATPWARPGYCFNLHAVAARSTAPDVVGVAVRCGTSLRTLPLLIRTSRYSSARLAHLEENPSFITPQKML